MTEEQRPRPDSDPTAHDPAPPDPAPPPDVAATTTRAPALGAPVSALDRISAVDTLRGVAVLGIFIMNIYAFSMPMAAYVNPSSYGGDTGADLITWFVTNIFVETKFMTIFSMLFGAGLVLMATRADARGQSVKGVYYRRLLWLALIGMSHAYFMWYGDILFGYAICGLILYPFRNTRPKKLILIGSAGLLIGLIMMSVLGFFVQLAQSSHEELNAAIEAGETPTDVQEGLGEAWEQMRVQFDPTEEQIEENLAIHRGGYVGILVHRLPIVFNMQFVSMPFFIFWRAASLMIIGMALMKLGVFSASRSNGLYVRMMLIGYAVGFVLVTLGAQWRYSHGFDPVYKFMGGTQLNYVGSIGVALGHVSVVMLLCRLDIWPAMRRRLAAVGRMALSNYLLQTVIGTTIFYGYAFGLYGNFGRFQAMGFVVAVWIVALLVSPLWLKHYRFGPAEWVWRSLTYRKRQPMRRDAPADTESAPAA